MLTGEEKELAEQRAMERVQQEIHEAEIRAYEQDVAEAAREKFRIESAKTDMLCQANKCILACGIAAAVGGFMLFKLLAMDLTYEWVIVWLWCVGIAIGAPIFFAGSIINDRIENRIDVKMRNQKKGARRLLLFSLIGSIVFIGLPRGYVHCPYDAALKNVGKSRVEYMRIVRQYEVDWRECRGPTRPELLKYFHDEEDFKTYLLYMFWIAFGASCLGLVLSGQLRNSRQV